MGQLDTLACAATLTIGQIGRTGQKLAPYPSRPVFGIGTGAEGVHDTRCRAAGQGDEPLRRPRRWNVGERDDLALRLRIATNGDTGQKLIACHAIDLPALAAD